MDAHHVQDTHARHNHERTEAHAQEKRCGQEVPDGHRPDFAFLEQLSNHLVFLRWLLGATWSSG